jgi:hypothetical protein
MLTVFGQDTLSIMVLVGGANEFRWRTKTPQTFSFPNARSRSINATNHERKQGRNA